MLDPLCDGCSQLPAILAIPVENTILLACWACGIDAMVFESDGNVYCDLYDEVPWLYTADEFDSDGAKGEA